MERHGSTFSLFVVLGGKIALELAGGFCCLLKLGSVTRLEWSKGN